MLGVGFGYRVLLLLLLLLCVLSKALSTCTCTLFKNHICTFLLNVIVFVPVNSQEQFTHIVLIYVVLMAQLCYVRHASLQCCFCY